jgi:preprotein translocase subunit SecA
MVLNLIKKLIASNSLSSAKRMKQVRAITALEARFSSMTDDQLKETTWRLKALAQAKEGFDTDLINQSFALVREAAKRVLNQRPYDVQIFGGLVLNEGKIAEMRTGEGKTLVAALPTYLNALKGRGVHVITVNDYLAARDAELIGRVHKFLGLTVGFIQQNMLDFQRKQAYACDVTYVTHSQVGFDYLRDNLRFDNAQLVQRGHHYAIIDEVDSVLIDDARTPLSISGEIDDHSDTYRTANNVVSRLKIDQDYVVDGKSRTVSLTEEGLDRVEVMLAEAGLIAQGSHLFTPQNAGTVHHLNAALKAHALFKKDKDYLIKDGEIVIIDEGTGRMMDGRRYSDGIHQAIEAKENVEVKNESQTLTSITYQNLFRMYHKLSGMTGTAATEADEFAHTYGLDVVTIPTNLPIARIDATDEIHLSQESKYTAIIESIREANAKGQPVLVGTPSVEKSEIIAHLLRQTGFTDQSGHGKPFFQVLNARNHEREADIIAQAGKPGAITIATNMAGRGTDIKLGGNEEAEVAAFLLTVEPNADHSQAIAAIQAATVKARSAVKESGGLFVIGTERHDSRRVDNQLRGRSGRQGDPGRSQFFVALDDELIRTFGSDQIAATVSKFGLRDGDVISHPLITALLDRAQRKVEGTHFEIRKDVVKFDDVVNQQRLAMHKFRQEIMSLSDCAGMIDEMRHAMIEETVLRNMPQGAYSEQWNIPALEGELGELLAIRFDMADLAARDGTTEETVIEKVTELSDQVVATLRSDFPDDLYELHRKHCLLMAVDQAWKEHLAAIEELKSVINFRTYAQREPIMEFRTDAYEMFKRMMDGLHLDVIKSTSRLRAPEPVMMINPKTPPTPEAA